MAEKLLVPLYLPSWLARAVVSAKRALVPSSVAPVPQPNIYGEREIEWTFLSTEMPSGPGEALEFGCEHGYLSLMAAAKGYNVLAVDLEEQKFLWRHPSVQFRHGDFLMLDLPSGRYDIIINCSSVEHVGIPGRYGIQRGVDDGDLRVMRRFLEILSANGLVLMTVPCGRDTVLGHWGRVYGEERLPRLLSGFATEREAYWVKDGQNRWITSSRERALEFRPRFQAENPHFCSYALAGLVLRKEVQKSQER